MQVRELHSWRLSPQQAVSLQKTLAAQVVQTGQVEPVRYVAGADISTERGSDQAYAGVVVMSYPDLRVVEQCGARVPLAFPYIPGLLAFREAPLLLKVFEKLRHEPDLIFLDGQGVAHPRGLGIASHMGLLLEKPTIGSAKSLLFGHFKEPGLKRGVFSYLHDGHGRAIGAVVRTRTGVKPIYVSVGHRLDLASAIQFALSCCPAYRIPEPIRQAHFFVNRLHNTPGFHDTPGFLDGQRRIKLVHWIC